MMIKETFFDSLLLSDSERIHSQMLAWILKLPENVFPTAHKTTFLQQLFDFEITIENGLIVHTEINRIDILLETDNHILVLENKLKSSEHSFQTDKYKNAVPDNFKSTGKIIKCAFITLIGEKPKNAEWQAISFKDIWNALNAVPWSKTAREVIFVEEYIQTLRNLVTAFDSFLANHQKFETVFIDGSKKKHEKFKYTDQLQDYIRINQLETIFQKAFLSKVAIDMNLQKYYITETRGIALIQVFIKAIEYEKKVYHIGLQFQRQCLKVNLTMTKNSQEAAAFSNEKRIKIPEKLADNFGKAYSKQNAYNRFNRYNKNAYISVSKTLSTPIYQMESDKIGEILKSEIDFIATRVVAFESDCQSINSVIEEQTLIQ
jgi:hypothetical protein